MCLNCEAKANSRTDLWSENAGRWIKHRPVNHFSAETAPLPTLSKSKIQVSPL